MTLVKRDAAGEDPPFPIDPPGLFDPRVAQVRRLPRTLHTDPRPGDAHGREDDRGVLRPLEDQRSGGEEESVLCEEENGSRMTR